MLNPKWVGAGQVENGYAVKKTTDNVPVWTIHYAAYEKIDSLHKLPGGVSAQTQYIPFTVTVVDNGDGKLTATANTGDDGLKPIRWSVTRS